MLKKKLIYLFPVLGAILAIGGNKAQAQIVGEVRANIPFEFHAGNGMLPAGNYTLHVLNGADDSLIEIRNDDTRAAALLETRNARSKSLPQTAELLFDHTGNEYY